MPTNLVGRVIAKLFPPSISKIEKRLIQLSEEISFPKVEDIDSTLDLLIDQRKSVSRFGDGEFHLCLGQGLKFQSYSSGLSRRLKYILSNPTENENCLVSVFRFDLNHMSDYWRRFWYYNYEAIYKLLDVEYHYGNANITRELNEIRLKKIQKVWNDRAIIFVVGEGSRFKFIEELYGNSRQHEFVFASAVDAWDSYDKVLEQCLQKETDDAIFLIALGPTATVLSWDLSKQGCQALDIGHLSNIYLTMTGDGPSPETLPIQKH